ncbi:MAG: serine/threonine-protein kinase, partial [Planctomycetota bacterium]
MTDENQNKEDLKPEKDQQWPEPTELSALDESDSGTIMDIEPTSPNLEPPSLDAQTSESSDAGVASGVLDASEPAPTLFQPTEAESVSPGAAPSNAPAAPAPAPTGAPVPASGAGLMTGSGSGSMGGVPVAPFGGKIVVGTRISQIEVTGVLGKGGMGEVFKGYHHALDIDVAIKVLPDELSRNELVRQRFLREARLCVKLDHPHIVRVYNVDEYAGNLYLVMEMIDGTDAAHMLKDGGRFAYTRALRIGEASAEALACAHGQGLVHRDVKPHNILLGREDGKIKISDFGLARAATSSSHLTMSGQIMGTPHY